MNPTLQRAEERIPTYRLYRERSGESGDFWLHCETIPARTHLHNYEINAHRHDSLFQIFLITEGSGEMAEPRASRPFCAPCALFIPHGAVHGFRYERDVDGLVVTALADRLRAVADADRGIGDFAAASRIVPLPEDDDEARSVREGLMRIAIELERPAAGRIALLEALMTTVIVGLARLDGGGRWDGEGPPLRDRLRVERLLALIGLHLREHRPAAFYAERLGMSPTHLNRLARATTGLSVQGLIARRMLDAAKRELIFTPAPVQKIAYSLGFSDPAYFNRFFRRQAGITPGAFREAERRRMER